MCYAANNDKFEKSLFIVKWKNNTVFIVIEEFCCFKVY